MTETEKWADKVSKLLRKAEDAATPEGERDLLLEKVQELITKHAIDEAILAGMHIGSKEQIIEERIEFHSIYSRALYYVGRAAAVHNDCKVMIHKGKDLMRTTLIVIGYESDVRRVETLVAHLHMQAIGAMDRFWRTYDSSWTRTERERFKVRRQFLFSFANGVDEKLKRARQHGLEDAAKEHGDNSVALVVRDKADMIAEWQADAYPNMRNVRGSFAGGGAEAKRAGREAGMNADVGHSKITNKPKRLNA